MVYGFVEAEAFRTFKLILAENDLATAAAVSHAIALLFEHHGETVPHSIRQWLRMLRT